MLLLLDPVLKEGIDLVLHILHLCELGAKIILARLDCQVIHLPLLVLVVDDHLRLHYLKCHAKKDQATHDYHPEQSSVYMNLLLLDWKEF